MTEFREKILSENEILTSYRLVLLANYFVGPIYAKVSQSQGIARGDFVVLFCLKQLGSLSAQDICEITRHPKNSVSQAVTKLVELGHLSRRTDASDGRRAILSLTAKGRAVYEKVISAFHEREASMLSVLTKSERAEFQRLLGKLVLRDDHWI